MQLDNSTKNLREFAYTMAGALVVIFCVLLPWIFSRAIPHWPLVLAIIFLLQAWIYPPSLIPIQKMWMRIGLVLGWINTRIILGILFFLLLTPLGLLQRKRDNFGYKTGYKPNLKTYKIFRNKPLTAKDLENPF